MSSLRDPCRNVIEFIEERAAFRGDGLFRSAAG
jgi:hypothetical protein